MITLGTVSREGYTKRLGTVVVKCGWRKERAGVVEKSDIWRVIVL